MSERLHLAITAYHDGTLDDAGARLLVAALQGPNAALVRERLAIDGLLAQAFTADDAVVRSVLERIDADRSASAMVRAVHRSLPTRGLTRARRRVPVPWLAVAALVLVVIAGGWWVGMQAPPAVSICRLQAVDQGFLQRAGVSMPARAGVPLYAADQLTTVGTATLMWPDGSWVELAADTRIRLERPTTGPRLQVDRGAVTSQIRPQRLGAPFTIVTEHARVEVLGTRFQVLAAARRTQVDLHHGAVRLTRLCDGRELTLQPQQGATVAPDVELVARPLVSAAATPAPSISSGPPGPPAQADWNALFPASGLAGWDAQHGTWSNRAGIVRGSDPRQGKARLISAQAFTDLELTCRLRLSGASVAEIQVGDYNWFVEVPAATTPARPWVEVRLQQRAEVLSGTADGVVLTPQAGAGRPMRAGPLAFYVMPGGTIEISDARIRQLK